MAKVIALKAKTATLIEKAALLLLAIRGLRDSVPAAKFAAVEALAYEVESLVVDGCLPWDEAR
jgi:hypothetical protein